MVKRRRPVICLTEGELCDPAAGRRHPLLFTSRHQDDERGAGRD